MKILSIVVMIILIVPTNTLFTLQSSAFGISNDISKDDENADNLLLVEAYHFRRFSDPVSKPDFKKYWEYIYIPNDPKDFFLEGGHLKVNKGDSVIISVVPVPWIAAQLGYTNDSLTDVLNGLSNLTATYRFRVPELENGKVILKDEEIVTSGPPPIVNALYEDDFMNLFSNISRNLSLNNSIFNVRWSIEGDALIFPVKLSQVIDREFIPYADTEVKFGWLDFGKFHPAKFLIPSSTGVKDINTTLDISNPLEMILQNTFILVPTGDGEITLNIEVKDILKGSEKRFTFTISIGQSIWAPYQGHGFSLNSLQYFWGNKGHFLQNLEYFDNVEYGDGTVYCERILYEISGINQGMNFEYEEESEREEYYLERPRINVNVIGYGEYGEAILQAYSYALLRHFYSYGHVYSSHYYGESWEGVAEEDKHESEIEEKREFYKLDLRFLFPMGGALPLPNPLTMELISKGQGSSISSVDYSHSYAFSFFHFHKNSTEMVRESSYFYKDEGEVSRYIVNDIYGHLRFPVTGYSNNAYARITLSPRQWGSTFKWYQDSKENSNIQSYKDLRDFSLDVMPVEYNLTGRGEILTQESRDTYLDLEVDKFYTTPNSTIKSWITVVRNGEGFFGDVNVSVKLAGLPLKNITVSVENGSASFTLKVPDRENITQLFGDGVDIIPLEIETVQGSLRDTEIVNIVMLSAIVGNLYGVDLDLTHGTTRTGGPIGGSVSYLDGRILDRTSAVGYERDPLIQLFSILKSDFEMRIVAIDVNTEQEYSKNLSVGAFILKLPPGVYDLKVRLKCSYGTLSTESVRANVDNNSVVQIDMDVPFALYLRTLKIIEQVKDWKVMDTDVYEMVLAALKTSQGFSALLSSLHSLDISQALDDISSAIFQNRRDIPSLEEFEEVLRGYMEQHGENAKSIAEAISTIYGTLNLDPFMDILPDPQKLPKYDPNRSRFSPEDIYYKLIKMNLYLAYLSNRRSHLLGEIKALSRSLAVRISVELTRSFKIFQAPIGPMKYLAPARWLSLKVPQILMLSLMGLDLSIGYSRDLTLSFLHSVGEKLNVDRAAMIVGYFKLVRFAFAYLMGELRKDLNFEVLFHLVTQSLAYTLLQIYLIRINGYIEAFVKNMDGDIEKSIKNAKVMDENTNNMELQMVAISKPLMISGNFLRMLSGVMDVAQAARMFSSRRYINNGEEVLKILKTEIGSTEIVSLGKATENEVRGALSPTLSKIFGSGFWSSLVQSLKRYNGYLLTLVSSMLFLEITGFLPFMGATAALSISNSTLDVKKISPEEIMKFRLRATRSFKMGSRANNNIVFENIIEEYRKARKRAALAYLSGNQEAINILEELNFAFSTYTNALSDFILNPWMDSSYLNESEENLRNLIQEASSLDTGDIRGYMIIMDAYPSLSLDGNLSLHIIPVGHAPDKATMRIIPENATIYGSGKEIKLSEKVLKLTFQSGDYDAHIIIEDSNGKIWSEDVIITLPVIKLRRIESENSKVFYIGPGEFKLQGNVLSYSGNVNYFIAISKEKMKINANVSLMRGVELDDGTHIYVGVILKGVKGQYGAAGYYGGLDYELWLIPISAVSVGIIGFSLYFFKKHRK